VLRTGLAQSRRDGHFGLLPRNPPGQQALRSSPASPGRHRSHTGFWHRTRARGMEGTKRCRRRAR
jgi:hypothetical protein